MRILRLPSNRTHKEKLHPYGKPGYCTTILGVEHNTDINHYPDAENDPATILNEFTNRFNIGVDNTVNDPDFLPCQPSYRL